VNKGFNNRGLGLLMNGRVWSGHVEAKPRGGRWEVKEEAGAEKKRREDAPADDEEK
jgi:hypothetical protein